MDRLETDGLPIAIVTARGGSKGIPRKNLVDLCGVPLIGHTIQAALASECFSSVVVSTEDAEIARASVELGTDVLERPPALAQDMSSSLDVLHHALTALESVGRRRPSFALLQPTSPLRDARHIREAWQRFRSEDNKALVSVTDTEHHPLKMLLRCSNGEIRPVSTWQDMTAARQLLPEALRVNGAIYFVEWAHFLEVGTVFSDPTGIYRMSRECSIDIDNMDDLAEAARILRRRG